MSPEEGSAADATAGVPAVARAAVAMTTAVSVFVRMLVFTSRCRVQFALP